ncbi:MAG: hypothetical protein MHPSP_004940, partial [Paramarteilia canceri]
PKVTEKFKKYRSITEVLNIINKDLVLADYNDKKVDVSIQELEELMKALINDKTERNQPFKTVKNYIESVTKNLRKHFALMSFALYIGDLESLEEEILNS